MEFAMHLSRNQRQLIAVALGSICVNFSCLAERGQVIDEATKKPIPGAFVFARWTGSIPNPVISRSRCYSFAITQADKDGKFTLPDNSWNLEPWLLERQRTTYAYAPGYDELDVRDAYSSDIPLRKYVGPALQRLERLATLTPRECMSEKYDKELLQLYRVMYEEAKLIAKEKKELEYLAGIRMGIARLTMGEKEFKRSISSGDYFK